MRDFWHDEPTRPSVLGMAILAVIAVAALALLVLVLGANTAGATWKPEYAALPQQTRDWYSSRTTTPETRARIEAGWYLFCCDHSDTVKAKFKVDKATGADRWFYQLPGESGYPHEVPADTVQPNIPTPDGQPVLFVDATGRNFGPVCFFPGVAGG